MLICLVIAAVCGIFSILFIISEINQGLNAFQGLLDANRGFRRVTLLWKGPLAFRTLVFDVAITLFVVWLFSMAGMIGMVLSLLSSAFISANLWIRRRLKERENLPVSRKQ